jgi:hypothetical protein
MFREFQCAELKSSMYNPRNYACHLLTPVITEDVASVSVLELEELAKMGEIKVQLTRCRITGRYKRDRGPSQFKETEDVVLENALEGRAISSRAK